MEGGAAMNLIDLHLLHLINAEWTHPVLDWLMPALSALDAWLPVILGGVLLAAWRGGSRARVMLLCLGLAVVVGDGLVSHTLKHMVGRPRPRDVVEGVTVRSLGPGKPAFMRLFTKPDVRPAKLVRQGRGNSFPSSHTVNLFAAGVVVACFYFRAGLVMLTLAIGVGYSRIYCGAHWPSDIPASMVIGVLTGLGVAAGVRRMPALWLRIMGLRVRRGIAIELDDQTQSSCAGGIEMTSNRHTARQT